MDLRGIANSVSSTVNSNVPIIYYKSDGYTIGAGQKQVPSYSDGIAGFGQVQALDSIALKHLEGLNIQGVVRAIYLYGDIAGVIRPDARGGDLIQIGCDQWLVVTVIEHWTGWCKVAAQYQGKAQ